MKFGNVKIGGKEWKISVDNVMADTGTSMNMLPDVDFNYIKDNFFGDVKCFTMKNGLEACDCTKSQFDV